VGSCIAVHAYDHVIEPGGDKCIGPFSQKGAVGAKTSDKAEALHVANNLRKVLNEKRFSAGNTYKTDPRLLEFPCYAVYLAGRQPGLTVILLLPPAAVNTSGIAFVRQVPAGVQRSRARLPAEVGADRREGHPGYPADPFPSRF
jgi:hypothetical protein